jgi:hypothetical protein
LTPKSLTPSIKQRDRSCRLFHAGPIRNEPRSWALLKFRTIQSQSEDWRAEGGLSLLIVRGENRSPLDDAFAFRVISEAFP